MTFLPVFLFIAVTAPPPDGAAIRQRLDALESHLLPGRDELDAPTRRDRPAVDSLRVRLDAWNAQIPDIIEPALDAGGRAGTTVDARVPGLTPLARRAVP